MLRISGWTGVSDEMVAAFGNSARVALEPVLRPSGKGKWKSYQASDEGPDALWEALIALDDEQATTLHGRLVALRSVTVNNAWAEPLSAKVAAICSLTLPSHIEVEDSEADQAEAA